MANILLYQSKLRAFHYFQSSSRLFTAAAATAAAATAADQGKAEATKACLFYIDRELKIKMELEKLLLEKKTAAIVVELNEWLSCNHLGFDSMSADPGLHIKEYLAE